MPPGCAERAADRSAVDVEQQRRVLEAPDEQRFAVRRVSEAADGLRQHRQRLDELAGLHIPEANRPILAARGELLAVGRDREAPDLPRVSHEAANLTAGGEVPETDGRIGGRGERLPIARQEHNREHLALVAAAREDFAVLLDGRDQRPARRRSSASGSASRRRSAGIASSARSCSRADASSRSAKTSLPSCATRRSISAGSGSISPPVRAVRVSATRSVMRGFQVQASLFTFSARRRWEEVYLFPAPASAKRKPVTSRQAPCAWSQSARAAPFADRRTS